MFEFLNRLFNPKQPEKAPAAKESPAPKEPAQQETPKPARSDGPTYEEWRSKFPELMRLVADALEKEIPGESITAPERHVFVSADVYGKYIDKIYIDISQSKDGKLTLKIDSGRRGSSVLVGEYFFEAGSTKEEIFNFLRSPEMPDILDKTITELDGKYKNR